MDSLILGSKHIVQKLARHYSYRPDMYLDLMQEGFVGAANAAKTFDPSRGCAFATYAYSHVKKHILAAVSRECVVRVPERAQLKQWRVKKICERAYARTGIHIDCVLPQRAAEHEVLTHEDTSQHAILERALCQVDLNRVASKLPRRERDVIKRCLEGMTLAEYGAANHVTKQRAQQIHKSAVEKMRKAMGA